MLHSKILWAKRDGERKEEEREGEKKEGKKRTRKGEMEGGKGRRDGTEGEGEREREERREEREREGRKKEGKEGQKRGKELWRNKSMNRERICKIVFFSGHLTRRHVQPRVPRTLAGERDFLFSGRTCRYSEDVAK